MHRLIITLIAISFLTACGSVSESETVVKKEIHVRGCEVINNADNQTECLSDIQNFIDQYLFSEGLTYFDIEQCGKISNIDRQKECEDKVNASGISGPITDDESVTLKTAMRLADDEQCAGLTTLGLKEYCEKQNQEKRDRKLLKNILLGADKKIERCEEIITESIKQNCLESFDQS